MLARAPTRTHARTHAHTHTMDNFKNVLVFSLTVTILVRVQQRKKSDVNVLTYQVIKRTQLCHGEENAL